MHRVIRIALVLILALVASGSRAEVQQAPGSPAKSTAASTPIPVVKVPLEAQSALDSLDDIAARISNDQTATNVIAARLSSLTREIDARSADDRRLLRASASLDMLYSLKLAWQTLGDDLSATTRELTHSTASLEEEFARLDKLNKTWQATLQAANELGAPLAVLQRAQSVVDSVEQTRQAAESDQAQVLTLQSRLSEEEGRVRASLSSVQQSQDRALKSLLVRDSPPIWSRMGSVSGEWVKQSRDSFSSQLKASTEFTQRLPLTFFAHAFLIALIATAVGWMRRRIRKLAEKEPNLQSALPILDFPISTGFALSMLIIPSIYPQAPRCIQAIMGAVMLIPTVVILRRLLERHFFPIINALVFMYFVSRMRVLAASLPELSRFIFLGEMLGGSLFLVWLLRSRNLRMATAESNGGFSRGIRAISKIGLTLLPAALLTNILGYVNLGNLLGIIFLRSIYIAAALYTAIRILEGLITIALYVRPLGSSRVVQLHRPMLQRRACRLLELLAFLFWLNLTLDFFGLRTSLIATTEAALNANLAIGTFSISLGRILAFFIAVWASFLVSKFLRFLLEEDVYHHLKLARGIPYAISTMLHYLILLLGFFIALGALGIDLTKVTILAGAFTVGIGFGLQNVINNFVSGLILLFERPIKIGDVIEVSGNVGEVRRIGIRASVIRTADGSEVILPNGSLISSQVTNWTFSDRQRAIEVAVNAAGGADPQRVVELLRITATSQAGIAKEPSPQVYVTNFTAGAVTFQLRAWTDRYRDWAQVRSDLSVAVNDALVREKIAIA